MYTINACSCGRSHSSTESSATGAAASTSTAASTADNSVSADTRSLPELLDSYAQLLIRYGVNVHTGQDVFISCPVEAADFGRRVVKAAYDAGAGRVTMDWTDGVVARLRYEHTSVEDLKTVAPWRKSMFEETAAAGACYLYLEGGDPQALAGIDPAKPAAASKAMNTTCLTWRRGMDYNRNAWSIGGVATPAWARRVFPELAQTQGDAAAVERLWQAILLTARVSGGDALEAWERHDKTFDANLARLNKHHFDRLVYRSSNGTNFTLGLTSKHVWMGGSSQTVAKGAVCTDYAGARFFPNIPTEEVFTTPDCRRADGVVHSALPLAHAGKVVRDFWLRFEGGRVVDFDARENREVLEHILSTDANACRLGECALVSKNTPIRQSGTLFFSTLYDENASCHLALGAGFPECYEGGEDLDKDELLKVGVNHSATHVDFMIGADDLSITGITADGQEIPVFVDGAWAWED